MGKVPVRLIKEVVCTLSPNHVHVMRGLWKDIPVKKFDRSWQNALFLNTPGIGVYWYKYMCTCSGSSSNEVSKSFDEKRRSLNRILYRSRQRGHLELDLILGKWTEENIQNLDDQHLKSLVEVLDLENPELWKWLTGQEVMPPNLSENPVFMEIHEKIMGALNKHSPSETRAKLGQPWVRGWDDNRKVGGPQVGNQ